MAVAMLSPFQLPVALRGEVAPQRVRRAADGVSVKAKEVAKAGGVQMALRWSGVVVAGAAVVLGLHLLAVGAAQVLDGHAGGPMARAAPVVPVVPVVPGDGRRLHMVRPGETFWSLAVEMQPSGDPRPLVDRLVRLNGGAGLVAGATIVLPQYPHGR